MSSCNLLDPFGSVGPRPSILFSSAARKPSLDGPSDKVNLAAPTGFAAGSWLRPRLD